jgi:hypothetical protein
MTISLKATYWRILDEYDPSPWTESSSGFSMLPAVPAVPSVSLDVPGTLPRYRFLHLSHAVSRWIEALDLSVEEAADITLVPAERLQAVLDGDYGKADASDAETAYLALLEHARVEPSKKTRWGSSKF